MAATIFTSFFAAFFILAFVAWRRYLWAAQKKPAHGVDTCKYSLTEIFSRQHLVNVPHQKGVRWLAEVFSRSARKFPHHTALQVPHTGESLTYAELDAHAEKVASARPPT